MAQTLTLNDLKRLSKMLETEHLTDTLCIIVFVSIMYSSLNDLIIIIILCMQIFVRPLCGSYLYCTLCNTVFISVHILDYRGFRISGVSQYAFYVKQLGPRRSVRLIEVSVFQGVRIEGFHCIVTYVRISYAIKKC